MAGKGTRRIAEQKRSNNDCYTSSQELRHSIHFTAKSHRADIEGTSRVPSSYQNVTVGASLETYPVEAPHTAVVVGCLIVVTVLIVGDAALAQVRFEEGVSLVRCKIKKLPTAAWGHLLPVVG